MTQAPLIDLDTPLSEDDVQVSHYDDDDLLMAEASSSVDFSDVALEVGFNPLNRDKQGRPIVNFEQFKRLRNGDRSMLQHFVIKMKMPRGDIGLVPCSKFHKAWGAGARPLELATTAERRDGAISTAEIVKVENGEMVVYRCSDRYNGCARFFDTEKGRKMHWLEHERGPRDLKKKPAVTKDSWD